MCDDSKRVTNHLIILVVGTLALVLLVVAMLIFENKQVESFSNHTIDFQACVDQGNPVMESYPRQCRDKAGNSFSEDIGNELLLMDSIIIESPRPNLTVSSPLKISGEAVGFWFFEASFPVKLVDDNGSILSTGIATAKGEWMTENFVGFESTLTFEKPTSQTGKLILQKDNPSGLAENDAELIVPVRFE